MRLAVVVACLTVTFVMSASAADVDPKALVLQQSDVPAALVLDRKWSGVTTNAEGDAGFNARSGRIVGYAARYVQRGRDTGVISEAELFRRPAGARMLLVRIAAQWSRYAPGLEWARAGIGVESRVYAGSVDTLVFWRHGRVGASVTGIGLTKQQTLALARKQQRRIAAALG